MNLPVLILLGLSAMAVVGLSLLMGYAGQVSLGQASFYAIGAYTAGLLAVHGVPTLLGLLAAPIAAAVVAAVVGVPILRLRGHQLAFATLALQLILLSVLASADWAGGAIGLQGLPYLSIGSFELDQDRDYLILVVLSVAMVSLIARNLVRSRVGRGLRALATGEMAAEASGVPVGAYRLLVFAVSAAFAGLAGGIYAFYLGYLAPGSFPVLLSIEYVVMAVVGGIGSIGGALAGAALITVVVRLLTVVATQPGMPSYAPSVLSYAVYALLLIAVVLFVPDGIVPTLRRRSSCTVSRRLWPLSRSVSRSPSPHQPTPTPAATPPPAPPPTPTPAPSATPAPSTTPPPSATPPPTPAATTAPSATPPAPAQPPRHAAPSPTTPERSPTGPPGSPTSPATGAAP
ncbi:branched-chain amino acid ABC transporter permease [Paractinoplanes globisporus]|uniref:Branched-chain amino acid ABC transporter permease n=1 Tax=Paractinoplanes globisporus TaxID=113565 RepID=A0ABW6WXC5_9ACTN|nr:branched-chain amino acid ABC transporter permease [Actinoplanes globisporus]